MMVKCMKGLLVASSTGGKDVITVMIRAIWVKPGKSGKQGYLGNMSSK